MKLGNLPIGMWRILKPNEIASLKNIAKRKKMKLGSLSTIGSYQPNNLIHICFDNNNYESTGGQKTTSNTTNFVGAR
jgi:hypothetical protein